ncbi:uncharacterized protein LAESUDRAFT_718559 [Laetiporus sulphureus 93-53]|uniref:Peptidase C14 n=1 Tax=Laetiporus sulphureus 93-53 TaxID=1314785 RepID=A0A165ATG7_9APHY|nr:uncharacterized protein LAESUDRAFT_718559 [Laetiporus sulphureus 93-53]KZS99633.1 hypothetical protein LAESUDRAFT_718559 [Laetiporus sulphureus 93-53]
MFQMVIFDTSPMRRATQAAILDAIRSFQDDDRIRTGDALFIFFAGHGGETESPIVTSVSSTIPLHLDEGIWADGEDSSNRGTEFVAGFANAGLRSHVLISACSSREVAMEENGRGIFTSALLEILSAFGVDQLTYSEIPQRIPALPGQNPQCEGVNQNRILFNVKVARRSGTSYIMAAGAARGITDGAMFAFYQNASIDKCTPPLGTLSVRKANTFESVLDILSGCLLAHALAQSGVVLQVKARVAEELRICIASKKELHDVFKAVAEEMESETSPYSKIILVDASLALLKADLQNGSVVFDNLDPLVARYKPTRLSFNVSADADTVCPVLRSAAHYFWHLRRTNTQAALRHDVLVEFTELTFPDDDLLADARPCRPNLNVDGVVELIVDEDTKYGIRIVNGTNLPLYPALFFFESTNLKIESYYQPPTAGQFTVDPPLEPHGSLTIGYGSSGSIPFNYYLAEGEDWDVGFLKLFLSTEPVDFSNIPQPCPVDEDFRGAALVKTKMNSVWDTMLLTVIQRRA